MTTLSAVRSHALLSVTLVCAPSKPIESNGLGSLKASDAGVTNLIVSKGLLQIYSHLRNHCWKQLIGNSLFLKSSGIIHNLRVRGQWSIHVFLFKLNLVMSRITFLCKMSETNSLVYCAWQ